MKIKFCEVSRRADSGDDCIGECTTKEELIKRFKEFVDNHGTHYNDYDEFHCHFVED